MKYRLKTIEWPGFQVDGKLALNMADFTRRSFERIRKQEEELFTEALRTVAKPPVKGEITKGKLTWRGIRLVRQQSGFRYCSWLEQRGKPISPKFHIQTDILT